MVEYFRLKHVYILHYIVILSYFLITSMDYS